MRELPQCGSETQGKPVLVESGAGRLARHGVTADLQLVRNAVCAKHDKAKSYEVTCACVWCEERT